MYEGRQCSDDKQQCKREGLISYNMHSSQAYTVHYLEWRKCGWRAVKGNEAKRATRVLITYQINFIIIWWPECV